MYRQNSLTTPRFLSESKLTPSAKHGNNAFLFDDTKCRNLDDSPLISSDSDLFDSPPPHGHTINEEMNAKIGSNWRSELKMIFHLAWPVSASTMAQIAMFNIDTAFLGHLGTSQLSGASLASIVAELTFSFLYAPAYGLNSLCAQAIGAGSPQLVGIWLQICIYIVTIMSIPTIILLFNVRSVLSLFEANEDILHYAQLFGQYSSLYILPSVLYMSLLQYFQSLEIVKPATIISFICIALNILLNHTLIYGIGDWNGLNFKGSPIATTLSTFIQLFSFWIWCIWIKRYHIKTGTWNGWTLSAFQKQNLFTFVKVIGPLTIGDASENWGYQIVGLWTAQLRTQDVAAMAVLVNIWSLLWSIFWGIGLATVIRSAKAVGKADIKSLKQIVKISLCLSIFVCATVSVLVYLCRRSIAQIFSTDDAVIHILENSLGVIALLFFFEGGIGWTAAAVLEAMSRNIIKAVVYTSSSWFLFVPLSIYFGIYSNVFNDADYAITMIWMVALGVCVLRCIVIWIALLSIDWKKECIKAKQRHTLKKKESDQLMKSLGSFYPLIT